MPNSPTNSSRPAMPGTTQSAASTTEGLDTETLREDFDAVVGEAKSTARKVADKATSEAGEIAEQAKQQLSEAADKAKSLAGEQKDLLAEQIGGVADAMTLAADELETNNGASAGYARSIADNAQRISGMIRDNDVDQLMHMAQDFGRRQPVAFLGAAALLGFAASRFLRASAQRTAADEHREGEGDDDLFNSSNSSAANAASQPNQGGY